MVAKFVRGIFPSLLLIGMAMPISAKERPRIEFDPGLLSGEHRQPVAVYTIVWSATLAEPDSDDPAIFYGHIENPTRTDETVLLRAGFLSRLSSKGPDQGWVWKAEEEIDTASKSTIPFRLKVECPSGVFVGIANRVYQAHCWLETEEQVKARRAAFEYAKRSRPIPAHQVIFHSEISDVSVEDATYAYTNPGHEGNTAKFRFEVINSSEKPEKIKTTFGFIRSDNPQESLWNRRTWHFVETITVDFSPEKRRVTGQAEIPCHVQMEGLVADGTYLPYILIRPDEPERRMKRRRPRTGK